MPDENSRASSDLALLIARRARDDGPRRFLEDIEGGRALTYGDLGALIRRSCADLDAAAVAPGGRVLIDVSDPIAFSAAHLGVISAGRCAVPVNPDAPAAERARTVAATHPTAVISDGGDRVCGLGLPIMPPPTEAPLTGAIPAAVDRPAGSALLLTSGSTGAPKGVQLTADRLLHVARAVADHHELTPEDRGFNPLPLFHVNAEVVALLGTLTAGATLILDRRFHRHGFWETAAERDVTWMNLVPAILGILAAHTVTVRPPRLRLIRSASAPLPDAVRRRIEFLTGVPVVESYGMTEAASQITAMPLDGSGPVGSCGRPVATHVEVRGSAGRRAPPGTIGQIWIRGPGVVDAYDQGRAPERFDAQGWLDTGDRGFIDDDGYLFLVGRSDDVINRGGELVYPREIEEVLIADPGVGDAVVIGRPDPILGQVPVAYVIPAEEPERVETPQELVTRLSARCAVRLSRYKLPRAIHPVKCLPRAATGKIQRQVLARADDRQEPSCQERATPPGQEGSALGVGR